MTSDRLREAADRLDTAEWLPASVDYATAALLRAVADMPGWVIPNGNAVLVRRRALALADSILGSNESTPSVGVEVPTSKCEKHTANTYVRFDKDSNKWVCARCGEVSPVDQ